MRIIRLQSEGLVKVLSKREVFICAISPDTCGRFMMTWPFDSVAEVAWEGGTPVTFWTLSRTSGRYECDRILRRGLAGFNSVSESFAKHANWTEFHFSRKLVTTTRAGA